MPFKLFGWSPSRKDGSSAESSTGSTPGPSRQQPVNMNTLPPGIRLSAFSAKLKTLRIENMKKGDAGQNADPTVSGSKTNEATGAISSGHRPSLPLSDHEVVQSGALPAFTSNTGFSTSDNGGHILSNESHIETRLPKPGSDSVNGKEISSGTEGLQPEPTPAPISPKPSPALHLSPEVDEVSKIECPDLTIEFAGALVTNLSLPGNESSSKSFRAEPESADSKSSNQVRLPDFEAHRYIPIIDKNDIARAEEMAARAVIAKYSPGTLRTGETSPNPQSPAKINGVGVGPHQGSFARYVENIDIMSLEKDHTISAWRRGWNEHFLSSGINIVEVSRKQDVEAYFLQLAETGEDAGEESARGFLRLTKRGEVDIDEFMAQVDEEEARCKRRYQERKSRGALEEDLMDYVDETLDSAPNRPWPHLPATPGWQPVKKGWRSHDGRLECIEAGIIPKFEYRDANWEEKDETGAPEPSKPVTIWSGARDGDDEHTNEDISFKLLGLEENWKASPTGMYMSRVDEDGGSDSDESDIGWSSNLLNHRLMLTCNSVNGSNVDLVYDPEELDIPAMDTNRHFAKMNCTLRLQYPNYVKPERKFNRMGEMVVIPPPVRRDKITRRPCIKRLSQFRYTRRNRIGNRKTVKFSLTHEQKEATDRLHPRQNFWVQKRDLVLKRAFREHGLIEMLPSVRAQHTRIKDFERYYPRFLQPPSGTKVRQTICYGAAYILNHIARFKLGLPTSEGGKTRTKIRTALKKVLQHRKGAQRRYDQNKPAAFKYKIFSRVIRRGRFQHVNNVLDQDVKIVGNFRTSQRAEKKYVIYWKESVKRNSFDKEDGVWVDIPDEEYDDREYADDDGDSVEEE
ncbi:hypothetical protein TWF281_005499 [Arthrobotrys megalospora]